MDFTMARAAGAYQYVEVTSASITLFFADTPRMFPFDISLNASKSPAGMLTFSWPTTSTSTMELPLEPVTLNTHWLAKRHRLPISSGKLSAFGFEFLFRGDSRTFN